LQILADAARIGGANTAVGIGLDTEMNAFAINAGGVETLEVASPRTALGWRSKKADLGGSTGTGAQGIVPGAPDLHRGGGYASSGGWSAATVVLRERYHAAYREQHRQQPIRHSNFHL
jgi:hypothetical protein